MAKTCIFFTYLCFILLRGDLNICSCEADGRLTGLCYRSIDVLPFRSSSQSCDWKLWISPPYTYPNRYFILKCSIISLIFIENKFLSDMIRNFKGRKKKFTIKFTIRTPVDCVEKSKTCAVSSASWWFTSVFLVLTSPITHWWAELV